MYYILSCGMWVKNKQSEVVVYLAVLATETYRLFPGLVQFMMGKRL